MNNVTDHSSCQRIKFKNWKWEHKSEHPALLDTGETSNQSCIINNQNTNLVFPVASVEHDMMILFHHVKPKQNQAKQKKRKLYFDNHAGRTETKVNPTFLLSPGKESNQTLC